MISLNTLILYSRQYVITLFNHGRWSKNIYGKTFVHSFVYHIFVLTLHTNSTISL